MTAAHAAAVLDTARTFLRSFLSPVHLLVAVSGGSDSVGTLLALSAAIAEPEFSPFALSACTVDHGLRPGSAEEAQTVSDLCSRLGIPHRTCRWDGEKPSTGLQAAARMARYHLLADAAHDVGADCIVTGHTRDDQRETIAMRTVRNDDEDAIGLSGMAGATLFARRTWILRPYLAVSRREIRSFVESRGESFVDDPSNSNRMFERVRVRQDLAGQAAAGQGAQARQQSSARAAGFLAAHARLFGGLVAFLEPHPLQGLDRDGLRAILTLAAVLGGRAHLPGRATAVRVSTFLSAGTKGRMTAGRVVFDLRRDGLYLYREARGLPILDLGAGMRADWDGRFSITNISSSHVLVSGTTDTRPVVAALTGEGLTEAVAKRAAPAAPFVRTEKGIAGLEAMDLGVERRIALHDTFLPCFDLKLADAIGRLFGRAVYRACPVHIV